MLRALTRGSWRCFGLVGPAFVVVGLVFAVSWLLERAALTASDPFEGAQTWLVERPLPVAAAVALLAALARVLNDRARPGARPALTTK